MNPIQLVHSIIDYALNGTTFEKNRLSENFFQIINGKPITLEEFHHASATLRREHPIIEVAILSMAESESCVHSHHLVVTVDKNEHRKRFEVFSRWDISNGVIMSCIESLREMHDNETVIHFFPEIESAACQEC